MATHVDCGNVGGATAGVHTAVPFVGAALIVWQVTQADLFDWPESGLAVPGGHAMQEALLEAPSSGL